MKFMIKTTFLGCLTIHQENSRFCIKSCSPMTLSLNKTTKQIFPVSIFMLAKQRNDVNHVWKMQLQSHVKADKPQLVVGDITRNLQLRLFLCFSVKYQKLNINLGVEKWIQSAFTQVKTTFPMLVANPS